MPCQTKLFLLKEYVAALDIHNKDVRAYSDFINTAVDGDLLNMVKKRIKESHERTIDARKRYLDHVKEHGCEVKTTVD